MNSLATVGLVIIAALIPLAVVWAESASAASSEGGKVFKAGAAASNITPWLDEGIVGGWSSPPGKYIHDELYARCLVLDDGSTQLAIVIVDNLGLAREVCDRAKQSIRE
ncbi:MAG TPA: hypothetical protein PKI05_05155, partial [Thermogutta sp.]|nr:hypothetical protein [Thermogutta sp.]